ncbi:hypothetical protein [Sphingomonas sp. 1P08PE]|uniref:hypothetical protein n=1 Tax=Sphingomonas sp. 1P08PE TaxID=554122 RepID=UPI0039A37130
MTHSPPVPPGNQSPFPRAEPPHPHHDAPSAAVRPAHDDDDADEHSNNLLTIAIVAGVGAIAAIAGTFLLRGDRKPKRRKPAGRGKPAKRRAKAD